MNQQTKKSRYEQILKNPEGYTELPSGGYPPGLPTTSGGTHPPPSADAAAVANEKSPPDKPPAVAPVVSLEFRKYLQNSDFKDGNDLAFAVTYNRAGRFESFELQILSPDGRSLFQSNVIQGNGVAAPMHVFFFNNIDSAVTHYLKESNAIRISLVLGDSLPTSLELLHKSKSPAS